MSYVSRTLIFLLFASSQAFAGDYIVGGQSVRGDDPISKSTVAVFEPSADGKSGSLCTGTLIKKNIAVTAAHCLAPGGRDPFVVFGPDLHQKPIDVRPVDGVAVNSSYGRSAGMDQGDIALVKFPGKLPDGFHEVPTLTTDAGLQPGTPTTLAGYGISDARTHKGSGRLRKTTVSVLDPRHGKSEMILDQSHGHGACHGDSGGPAYVRQGRKIVLAGLTNRSYPNSAPDDCAHQVVYTKLPAYRSWISKHEKSFAKKPSAANSTGPILSHRSRAHLGQKRPKHGTGLARHVARGAKHGQTIHAKRLSKTSR